MGELGPRLKVRGMKESLVAGKFEDDTVLLAENEGSPQRTVEEFDKICKKRKRSECWKERAREQVSDFARTELEQRVQ